jgi:hypothetical protein
MSLDELAAVKYVAYLLHKNKVMGDNILCKLKVAGYAQLDT